MTEPSPDPDPRGEPEPDPGRGTPAHSGGARRRFIVLIGAVVGVGVLVALLVLPSRDSAPNLDEFTLAELHEMTQERVEGLRGLVDIAAVAHDSAAGSVFDETEREALAEQERLARDLLRQIDDDGGQVTPPGKVEAVEEYKRVSLQIGALFETIRDVQDAVDQYDEAH